MRHFILKVIVALAVVKGLWRALRGRSDKPFTLQIVKGVSFVPFEEVPQCSHNFTCRFIPGKHARQCPLGQPFEWDITKKTDSLHAYGPAISYSSDDWKRFAEKHGTPIAFVIHRCILGYGGESCGQDPCVVPEGPETKWERYSADGLGYDGMILHDTDEPEHAPLDCRFVTTANVIVAVRRWRQRR